MKTAGLSRVSHLNNVQRIVELGIQRACYLWSFLLSVITRSCSITLCAFSLLIASAFFARDSHAAVFSPKSFELDNGLQVVVIENHRAPIVVQMLWYRVGAADEKPGESGLAHFLEHLLFKGTKTTAPGEFSRTVSRIGGRDNAFTSSIIYQG